MPGSQCGPFPAHTPSWYTLRRVSEVSLVFPERSGWPTLQLCSFLESHAGVWRLFGRLIVISYFNMCDLIPLLMQCQRDTLEILGEKVAGLLSHWENHRDDHERLIKFVQDRIHGDTWENGAKLEANKRLSLEAIVIQCGEPTFEARDIAKAKETLTASAIVDKIPKRLR
jgi:hypothetical protein